MQATTRPTACRTNPVGDSEPVLDVLRVLVHGWNDWTRRVVGCGRSRAPWGMSRARCAKCAMASAPRPRRREKRSLTRPHSSIQAATSSGRFAVVEWPVSRKPRDTLRPVEDCRPGLGRLLQCPVQRLRAIALGSGGSETLGLHSTHQYAITTACVVRAT